MSYDPISYWRNRAEPAPIPLPDYAKEYITRHIADADKILDYGVGNGRLLPLYEGKKVIGYDIVPRDVSVRIITELKGYYDCVVASKVFLHIKPQNIERCISLLKKCAPKIVVYDTVAECTADHNFLHDFSRFGEMVDKKIIDKDLLFCYEH